MTNDEYAVQIARDWNAGAGQTGFVTAFDIDATHLESYDRQVVGDGRVHIEYWIPAEDLDKFNSSINGTIKVLRAFRVNPPQEIPVAEELTRVLAATD